MEYRNLEITGMSARDLNKVNLISKMDVYVIVQISGGSKKDDQKKKTPVDNDGDTCPSWKIPMNFQIDESYSRQNRLTLVFKVRCERALGDKDIGEVHVPIKELLDSPAAAGNVSYQVMKPNGKPKGQLTFSYKFGEKVAETSGSGKAGHQPVTAYPAHPIAGSGKAEYQQVTAYPAHPMAGSSSVYPPPAYPPPAAAAGHMPYPPPKDGAYPPPAAVAGHMPYPPPKEGAYPPPAEAPEGYPPHKDGAYPPPAHGAPVGYPQVAPPPQGGYGYAYPPQQQYGGYPPPPQQYGAGYGYPPQAQGYGGYPPVVQPAAAKPAKKNKFGMGLGAGLLGGALGGLLIGDMVSDASSFDGGFDGGFDF